MKIRIGTRGSKLALYQAELVQAHLRKNFEQADIQICVIKTSGDMIRQKNPVPLETKRMFTKEIEDALLAKEVDLAVHSAKDLAAKMPEGLRVGAVLEREDPRDCFIHRDGKKLSELPDGTVIGTSALRRQTQLLRFYPGLKVENIRGNVDTRIRKVLNREYEGILLAYAGVKRLGLQEHVSEILDEKFFYPAPGQGVIVVQCREKDQPVLDLLRAIHHEESGKQLTAERVFLAELEGGCQLPCGMTTRINGPRMEAAGVLLSPYQSQWVEADFVGFSEKPEEVGHQLAKRILEVGGRVILDEIRRNVSEKITKARTEGNFS